MDLPQQSQQIQQPKLAQVQQPQLHPGLPAPDPERLARERAAKLAEKRRQERIHYYVKIVICTFLTALLLIIGVPVFMESRVTGSLSYTALGCVLVVFGLLLAVAVVVMLFRPPAIFRRTDDTLNPSES